MTAIADGEVRRTGQVLEAMYQLTRWLIPTVNRFPGRQKFVLGDRIQTTALAGLERLVEATFTRNRARLLDWANVDLDKLPCDAWTKWAAWWADGGGCTVTPRAEALFGRIALFPSLVAVAERAARGKRRKPGVAAFLARLEPEVSVLSVSDGETLGLFDGFRSWGRA